MFKKEKAKRRHYEKDFDISNLKQFTQEVKELKNEKIESVVDLQMFIKKVSEFNRINIEEISWRYIKLTGDLQNAEYAEIVKAYNNDIIANIDKYNYEFNKKIYNSPFRIVLPNYLYSHLMKLIKIDIELYHKNNIDLLLRCDELEQRYYKLLSSLYIDINGKPVSVNGVNKKYQHLSLKERETIWNDSLSKKLEHKDIFNILLTEILNIRTQIANNVGEKNYVNYNYRLCYKHNYSKDDVSKLKDIMKTKILPKLAILRDERAKQAKGSASFYWNKSYLPFTCEQKPYVSTNDLVQKSIKALSNIRDDFAEELRQIYNAGLLDIEIREGKRFGGYCCQLPEHRGAFIFINALGSIEDLNVMFHQIGHLLHYNKSTSIQMTQYFDIPVELNELSSLTMELLLLDQLHEFYDNELDILRIKRQKLYEIMAQVARVLIVDDFVEWMHENPNHSVKERDSKYQELTYKYDVETSYTDQDNIGSLWVNIPHLYSNPYFFIKCFIAQIGAVKIYKNYKRNKKATVKKFSEFLTMGYSMPIEDLYEHAGIKFDFSEEYVKDAFDFLVVQLNLIHQKIQQLSKQDNSPLATEQLL